MTRTGYLTAVCGTALLLGACTEEKLSNSELNSLSCTGLAREIGKFTQIKKAADQENLLGNIDLAIARDEDDQIDAGVRSIESHSTSEDAEKELARLQAVFIRRGCS